jgi:hypothetical protein
MLIKTGTKWISTEHVRAIKYGCNDAGQWWVEIVISDDSEMNIIFSGYDKEGAIKYADKLAEDINHFRKRR